MKLLLIMEDLILRRQVSKFFAENKYDTDTADEEKAACYLLSKSVYDLVILGSNLRDTSWSDLLKEIRRQDYSIPIIILDHIYNTNNKIEALDNGADDYICQSATSAELLARTRSLLRRILLVKDTNCLRISNLELHLDMGEIRIGAEADKLTAKTAQIFAVLIKNSGKFISKERLINSVWGTYGEIEPNNIDVYIHRLRKMPLLKKAGIMIETRKGIGYRVTAIGCGTPGQC